MGISVKPGLWHRFRIEVGLDCICHGKNILLIKTSAYAIPQCLAILINHGTIE